MEKHKKGDGGSPEVVIYSSEGCKPCETAKEYIKKEKGEEIEEKDIREEMDKNRKGPRFLKVPKICVGDECITGFNPDEIDNLIDKKRQD